MPYSGNKLDDMAAIILEEVMSANVADMIGKTGSAGLKMFFGTDDTSDQTKAPGSPDEMMEGGEKIVRHLRIAQNAARGTYKGYDQLNTDPNRKYDKAEFELYEYYDNMVYSEDDLLMYRGDRQQIDKMRADIAGSMQSMMDMLATGLYNTAAARVGLQAKGMYGLGYFFSAGRLWGNILDTGNTFWTPKILDASAYTTDNLEDPTNAGYLLKLIKARQLAVATSTGGRKPTKAITSLTTWDRLEEIVRASKQFTSTDVGLGELGYERLKVFGMEVYADSYCPAGNFYMFTPNGFDGRKNYGIVGRKDAWFTQRPWKKAYNSEAMVKTMICHAGLYVDQPRMQAALINLAE